MMPAPGQFEIKKTGDDFPISKAALGSLLIIKNGINRTMGKKLAEDLQDPFATAELVEIIINQSYPHKSLIDIIGAVVGLIILAPFYPFLALAIKLDSPGPALVKLNRISQGRIFDLYKFRTMMANAEELKPLLRQFNERRDSPFFKMRRDPRVTRVGRFLRRFRLDELPQLINVLQGEMSLVGPRPVEPSEAVQYPASHRHLLFAKAGVTGLSQIKGSSALAFQQTLEYDDYYLKNQSLALDIKIISTTLAILLFDHNAV